MGLMTWLILSLLARSFAVPKATTWQRLGTDMRFIKSGTSLATVARSLTLCAGHCGTVPDCLAFNYGQTGTCELLSAVPYSTSDPALGAETGWSFYFMGLPQGDPCKNSGCPETSMCLTYDQALEQHPYDPSLPTFTCAAHPWFLKQQCRFKIQYNMHFQGDVVDNNDVTLPYYDSLQACLQLNCLSLCCDGATNYCYLKTSFHVLKPSVLVSHFDITYWYPDCV